MLVDFETYYSSFQSKRREEPCIKRVNALVCIFCGDKRRKGKSHGGAGSRDCPYKKQFYRRFRDELIEKGEWNHVIVEVALNGSRNCASAFNVPALE